MIQKFYAVMNVADGEIVYSGHRETLAATALCVGTVFGSGSSEPEAKHNANIQRLKCKCADKVHPLSADDAAAIVAVQSMERSPSGPSSTL